MAVEREALGAFISENWSFFDEFSNAAEESLKQVSRQLPAEFYSEMRHGIMGSFIAADPESRLRARLVVDTNILVMDALRVADGRPSSTERILSSKFVEVLAPPQVREEAERNLRKKLRGGAKLNAALDHVGRLLSRIKIVSEFSQKALEQARSLIGARAPEDVCFLALALDMAAGAILSRDKVAFDSQKHVTRWELGKAVQLVVDRESGSLSLLIASTSIVAVGRALEWLLTVMLRGLAEVAAAGALLVSGIVEGTAEALSKVPSWVWIILGIAAGGFLAAYALQEGFREWVNSHAAKGFDFVASVAKSAVAAMSNLFALLRNLLIVVWNLLVPVTAMLLFVCGVLASRISSMLKSMEDEIGAAAS